jgi:hypothetical protein
MCHHFLNTFNRAKEKARAMVKEGVNHQNRLEKAGLGKALLGKAGAKDAVARAELFMNTTMNKSTRKIREQKAPTVIEPHCSKIPNDKEIVCYGRMRKGVFVARERPMRIEWPPSEKRKIPVYKE